MKQRKPVKQPSILAAAIMLGGASLLSQPAFALDSRCTLSNYVATCLGNALQPGGGPTGAPQQAILLNNPGYGFIVKDFDYLVPGELGPSEAGGWGTVWIAGMAAYGHMSAEERSSPEYRPGTTGWYTDNVTIKGEASLRQIAGIIHYSSLNTGFPHWDEMWLDNINIDVANVRVEPFTSGNVTRYRVMGVLGEDEGTNKNHRVTIGGDSNIIARKTCKIGERCFYSDKTWASAGVTSYSRLSDAEVVLGEGVTITTFGDLVFGAWAHTGSKTGSATLRNAGLIVTNDQISSAIRVDSHEEYGVTRKIAVKGIVENTGQAQALGKDSHGIDVLGFKDVEIHNDGAVFAFGENGKGIYVGIKGSADSAETTPGNSTVILGENSLVAGGSHGNASAGLYLTHHDGEHTINNAGYLTSGNYRSIYSDYRGSSEGDISFKLDNAGTIAGFQQITSYGVEVKNHPTGIFSLEKLDDGWNKTQVESSWSGDRHAEFYNAGTISFGSIMDGDAPNHGVFSGIGSFYQEYGGIIDLTTNNKLFPPRGGLFGENNRAGDSFRITDAGQSGESVFYSEGGIVRLNTDFTTANKPTPAERISDRLIVDNAMTTSTGQPTWLEIVPTRMSGLGGAKETVGEGILVVEVKGQSSSNAFALVAPVMVGGKTYELRQVNNRNWYLVSR